MLSDSQPKNGSFSVSLPLHLDTSNILDFATYMLTNCSTPERRIPDPEYFHLIPLASSCVSPVVALRAWALLALMGVDKTRKSLHKNVAKIIGSKPEEIHEWLSSVDSSILGAIHFFADNPKDVVLDEDVTHTAEEYYKNKVLEENAGVFFQDGSPIVNMCFACDPDGMRSIYLINKTIREATNNRIQYIVREEHAPYRVSMTVLTSAVDCTFYWKYEHKTKQIRKVRRLFHGEEGAKSAVDGWMASGNFSRNKTEKGIILRLDSHRIGLNLLLFLPHGETPPTAAEILEAGRNIPTKPESSIKIFVPEFFVSVPLGLRDCSRDGPFNMKRVFDREKADLSGHLKDFHGYNPTITMLWDHYHKAVFKFVAGDKELPRQGGVESEMRLSQTGRRKTFDPANYYEDHLPQPEAVTETNTKIEEATGDFVFDRLFYFMVVQDIDANALLHCYGRYSI